MSLQESRFAQLLIPNSKGILYGYTNTKIMMYYRCGLFDIILLTVVTWFSYKFWNAVEYQVKLFSFCYNSLNCYSSRNVIVAIDSGISLLFLEAYAGLVLFGTGGSDIPVLLYVPSRLESCNSILSNLHSSLDCFTWGCKLVLVSEVKLSFIETWLVLLWGSGVWVTFFWSYQLGFDWSKVVCQCFNQLLWSYS